MSTYKVLKGTVYLYDKFFEKKKIPEIFTRILPLNFTTKILPFQGPHFDACLDLHWACLPWLVYLGL